MKLRKLNNTFQSYKYLQSYLSAWFTIIQHTGLVLQFAMGAEKKSAIYSDFLRQCDNCTR